MNIKDFIENIIKEEMQALKEDEANMKPGGEWTQPGVTDRGLPPDESIRGTTAEIVASILDLLADYEIGHDGAIEVVHELADELGLVPADEAEPEKNPIGFRIDEMLKKRLSESSYEEIMRIRDSGDYSWRDMEYEVVDLMESMQTFPAKDVIEIMYDALDAEDRQDINFWHMMLGNGGHLYQALDGLKATADEEYMPDTVAEAKGLASARVAQHGLDTAPSGMDDAHRAVVDAGGYKSPGMMAFMRALSQAARGTGLTPEETLDLAKQMLNADWLETAETAPSEMVEGGPAGHALQGQELRDALHSDISDMFKDMNGIRPRWINFQAMSMEELENLHHLTNQQHRDWWNQERVEQDLDDINYEKELRNAMQHDADVENARLDAIEAETERMREPEEGEEQAKQSGMGRRYSPGKLREADSWSSYGNAKNLFEGWRKFAKE